MSPSDDVPGWDAFTVRDVPEGPELVSPASEVAALLQRYHADLARARDEIAAASRAGLESLAEQAVLVVQLAAALERYESLLQQASLGLVHRHLRVLKDQMMSAIAAAGLEIVVPLGRPFDEVADRVHVDGWRHREEFAAEVVAEVVEPIVMSGGALVRAGRVVMGAPASARPDEE
jgi:hypothetical protein